MERALLKDFTKYVSLNILGMVSLSLYVLGDTFFVSLALGAAGLAALNLSIAFYSILQGIGLMIGIGGATRFSILRSQDKIDESNVIFSSSVKFGLIVGIAFAIIGLLGSEYISLALGADSSTFPMTNTYLKTILSFSPFFILNNIVIAFVRNDNNPKLSMIAMFAGSLSNVFLDYVFMFPLGMGMFGAAFATGLAPVISLIILILFHFVKKNSTIILEKGKIIWSSITDILSLGLSSFIGEFSSAVVLITFNLVILGIRGNLGVASYGIVANLALMATAVFTGLAQGIQPIVSRYHGLKDYTATRKILQYALSTSILMSAVIYIVSFIYSNSIVGIFNSENNIEIANLAEYGLKIYFIGFFFVGLNIVIAMFQSAVENPRDAFIISISRGLIVIVPMVLILSNIFNMTGVWLSFVCTEVFVAIIAVYLLITRRKIIERDTIDAND